MLLHTWVKTTIGSVRVVYMIPLYSASKNGVTAPQCIYTEMLSCQNSLPLRHSCRSKPTGCCSLQYLNQSALWACASLCLFPPPSISPRFRQNSGNRGPTSLINLVNAFYRYPVCVYVYKATVLSTKRGNWSLFQFSAIFSAIEHAINT